MTLIISAITPYRVIQSSDRQLTNIVTKKPHPIPANKTIVVTCKDAMFAVSYTGLAYIGSVPTDKWLHEYLTNINAGNLEYLEILERIKIFSTQTFLKIKSEDKRITFAFAGYHRGLPFRGGVSNMELETGEYTALMGQFVSWSKSLVSKKKSVVIVIHGRDDIANMSVWKHIKSSGRKIMYQEDGEACVNEIVDLIRAASRMPNSGIGVDCVSVMLVPNKPMELRYHPKTPSVKLIAPHIIQPNISFKDIEVWTQKPPDWD